MAELNLIWVKSGLEDNRVALFERNEEHPEGEAYVAGHVRNKLDADGRVVLGDDGKPITEPVIVQVARTPKVKAKLLSGELIEVDPPKVAATETKADKAAKIAA